MTDPLDLDELERLEKAATPGPWSFKGTGGLHMDGARDGWMVEGPHNGKRWPRIARDAAPYRERGENPALIAALRNAAPALIAEIRRLREENARLREAATTTTPTSGEHHPQKENPR